MTLPIYDTGLSIYIGYPLTQEGAISVGDGKFVIVSRYSGPADEIGFVVVQLDSEGVPTFGTPGYFATAFSGTNPLAYYDKSQGRIVVFFDDWPAVKYIIASVSGDTLVEDNRSTLSAGNNFHYAVAYDEAAEAAVLCSVTHSPNIIKLYSLKLSGGILTETEAASSINGKAYNDNCKISICGDFGLLAFVNILLWPNSEVRVLSGIGTPAFDLSVGYSVPLPSHGYCLGLSGTSDGLFTGYWSDGTSNIPYLVAGEIDSGGNIVFGDDLQYAGPDWGGLFGDFIGSGVGASGGVGAFAQRINHDAIHMFSIENSGSEPFLMDESTSVTGLWLERENYDHVPVAFDPSTGYALCAFYVQTGSSAGNVHVATLKVALPSPEFWTNHTLQREISAALEKRPTKKIIPGKIGQPYIAPTPAVSSRLSVYHGSEKSCKRVGV